MPGTQNRYMTGTTLINLTGTYIIIIIIIIKQFQITAQLLVIV
jgi:fluoride ion exporter CrcB/FEX